MTPTPVSLDSGRYTSTNGKYQEFIKACAQNTQDSELYYNQLLDYIKTQYGVYQPPHALEQFQMHIFNDPKALDRAHSILNKVPLSAPHSDDTPRIFLSRGLMSPSDIEMAGAMMYLRPEFFLEHLGLNHRDMAATSYYESPPLASSQTSFCAVRTIRLIRIRQRKSHSLPLASLRRRISADFRKAERKSYLGRKYNQTIGRSLTMLSSELLALEQQVLVAFPNSSSHNTWTGVFVVDEGTEIATKAFLSTIFSESNTTFSIVPVIPYNWSASSQALYGSATMDAPSILDPFALFSVQNGEEYELARKNLAFSMLQLLLRTASCWNQALNLIENEVLMLVTSATQDTEHSKDPLNIALDELRFFTSFIDTAAQRLENNERIVHHIIRRKWMPEFANSQSPAAQRIGDLERSVADDYTLLRHRCDSILRSCGTNSGALINAIQGRQFAITTEQAGSVNQLTRLAVLLIPASFVATCFGMNISALEGNPSIGYFFALAVPVSVLAWLLMSWKYVKEKLRWLSWE